MSVGFGEIVPVPCFSTTYLSPLGVVVNSAAAAFVAAAGEAEAVAVALPAAAEGSSFEQLDKPGIAARTKASRIVK